jgi:hypothetical protein
MSDDDLDPGANTEMFQAFVDRAEPESPSGPSRAVVWGLALVVLVIVVLLAWLVLG